ncbi:MAG: hypothetical protein ACYTXI_24475 [Nostoc sp.]
MKIESYFDGELIKTGEINVVLSPDFTGFINRMLLANSYTKLLINSTNQQAKSRLELAAVRLELKSEISNQDMETFKLIWDAVIGTIPINIIDNQDLIELREIAESTNMPFAFGLDFKIELQ